MKRIAITTVLVLLLAGCGNRHASDNRMLSEFKDKKPAFDRIREMIAQDNRTLVVLMSATDTAISGIPPAHIAEYRKILTDLGARSLSYHAGTQGSIVIELSKMKHERSTDISTKGYVWLNRKPDGLSDNLNKIEPNQPVMYRNVDDGWYLFTRRRN
jgi:hypothetical protein